MYILTGPDGFHIDISLPYNVCYYEMMNYGHDTDIFKLFFQSCFSEEKKCLREDYLNKKNGRKLKHIPAQFAMSKNEVKERSIEKLYFILEE